MMTSKNQDIVFHKDTPLIEHMLELRRRLIYCLFGFAIAFCGAYFFAEEIFTLLTYPLVSILKNKDGQGGHRFIYTHLAEAFVTYIKVALFSAVFITLPIIINQIWLFVTPGLYHHERKIFFPVMVATPLLFIIGALFAYFIIIPNAWEFFLKFESIGSQQSLPIQLEARMAEYLSITMQLLLAFGICFELPILLVVLARLNIVQGQMLARHRKYAFLILLIISALLTPPDVLSMIGLAIPLYGLYELSILLIKIMERQLSKGVKSAELKMDL